MRVLLLSALFSFAGADASAQSPRGMPEDLVSLMRTVREFEPGVGFFKLYATITPDGKALCRSGGIKGEGVYANWGLRLRNRQGKAWMVIECSTRKPKTAFITAGPVVAPPIVGIETALETMRSEGLKTNADGLVRASLSVPKWSKGTPIWALVTDFGKLMIDARTGGVYGRKTDLGSVSPRGPRKKRGKPKDTARENFRKVMAYAKRKYPGATLRAVDSITDGRGSAKLCTPGMDGWAFYFHVSKLNAFRVVYSCGKDVSEGKAGRVPADPMKHKEIPEDFIDSHAAMLALRDRFGKTPRNPTMRLLNFRRSPYPGYDLLWVIEAGRTEDFVDAVEGKYMGRPKSRKRRK